MPNYDFKCNACKIEFIVASSPESLERERIRCPVCHNPDVQRVYTPTPVIYKTDGFYTTDSKKDLTK